VQQSQAAGPPLTAEAGAEVARLDQLAPASYADGNAAAARAVFQHRLPKQPREPIPITDIDLDIRDQPPVSVRMYRPSSDEALPSVMFVHGGGWVLGNLVDFDPLCSTLARRTGCAVVSVGYRLAPENRFPAAAEDCVRVLRWLAASGEHYGLDGSRLALVGDSAGGNLVAAAGLVVRAPAEPRIRCQCLIYPMLDLEMDTQSHRQFGVGYGLTHRELVWFRDQYLGDPAQRADPMASPARAPDLRGSPPTYVMTAQFDPLRDEAESYAARLVAAGVATVVRRHPGMLHGFLDDFNALPAADRALDELAGYLRANLSARAVAESAPSEARTGEALGD
jgi:acetyl esterase